MDDLTPTDARISSASSAAKDILSSALNNLKGAALSDENGQPRLFFPEGIELIEITVEVAGVKVGFKVAGKEGFAEGSLMEQDHQETGGRAEGKP